VTLELGRADAGRVSFPDLAMLTFSLTARELAFTAEGVFVEGMGLVDAPCRALLTAEAAITARMFKHEQWLAADLSTAALHDICEWIVEGDDLILSGFGASSGYWTEIRIPRFSATIRIDGGSMATPLDAVLRDLTLSHAWTADGALFLEFGRLSPSTVRRRDGSFGNPTGEVSACLYDGWRVEENGTPLPPSALVGRRLIFGTAAGEPPELDLAFESGARIVSYARDGEAPDWALADRRGATPVWYAVDEGRVRAGDGGR